MKDYFIEQVYWFLMDLEEYRKAILERIEGMYELLAAFEDDNDSSVPENNEGKSSISGDVDF